MAYNDDVGSGAQEQPRLGRRVARPVAPMVGAVILADVSSSMEDRDGTQFGMSMPPRRIDRLAQVLDYLLKRVRVQALICFNDMPIEVPLLGRVVLPEPAGGTGLDVALEYVFGLRPRAERLFVLSDGWPNNPAKALGWAKRLRPMVIDAYYIGPDGLDAGAEFMRELAACGAPGGKSGHFDMFDPTLLGAELHKRLLAGPGR